VRGGKWGWGGGKEEGDERRGNRTAKEGGPVKAGPGGTGGFVSKLECGSDWQRGSSTSVCAFQEEDKKPARRSPSAKPRGGGNPPSRIRLTPTALSPISPPTLLFTPPTSFPPLQLTLSSLTTPIALEKAFPLRLSGDIAWKSAEGKGKNRRWVSPWDPFGLSSGGGPADVHFTTFTSPVSTEMFLRGAISAAGRGRSTARVVVHWGGGGERHPPAW